MMTLLTTPGIKLMGAARLDREQRVGEGVEEERRERRKKGRRGLLWRNEEKEQGSLLEWFRYDFNVFSNFLVSLWFNLACCFFFWVSFVVWSGCRKPFVRLVKFRACLLCFRVLFWAFCFGGRSIPDALFFPFTYCIRATFLLLKESACIGITNFPLLVSCSCTRTMHAVATPVFTSLSFSLPLSPVCEKKRTKP